MQYLLVTAMGCRTGLHKRVTSSFRQILALGALLAALVGFPTAATAQGALPEPIYFGYGVKTQRDGQPPSEIAFSGPGSISTGFDDSPLVLGQASLSVGISHAPTIWATGSAQTGRFDGLHLYQSSVLAGAGVTYSFEIVSDKNSLVPVSISSSGFVRGSAGTIDDGRMYFSASADFILSDPAPYVNANGMGYTLLGASACTRVDWCFGGAKYIVAPGSSGTYEAGFHDLVQTIQLRSNKIYHVTIWSHVELWSSGGGGLTFEAMIDPYIEIDPAFNIGGEYSLAFSPGVGNSIGPVPEPETYAMMVAGLGLLSLVAGRRKAA